MFKQLKSGQLLLLLPVTMNEF